MTTVAMRWLGRRQQGVGWLRWRGCKTVERWRATVGGKRLLRLRLAPWLVFLAPTRWVAMLFAELMRRLAMATVAASMVGKEFALGSRRLDLGAGRSTDTAILVGRRGREGRRLLAIFVVELAVALIALDAFCIRCLSNTVDHHDVEGVDALALSLSVVGHGVPTDCARALSVDRLTVAAVNLDGEDDDDG
jgi:hypothetical protein